jgi:hypothetical protein
MAPTFERLTRIVCHFPLNRQPNQRKGNQLHVVAHFIEYLKKSGLNGFSMSSLMDTVYTGFWRSQPHEEFEEENVVLFVIDYALDRNDPALWKFMALLKREIQRLYRKYAGEKEQDVWIVAHSIDRLV